MYKYMLILKLLAFAILAGMGIFRPLMALTDEQGAPSARITPGYPFYLPMSELIEEPQFVFKISCALSNAAGQLRTEDNKPVRLPNRPVFTGVTFIYEPGEYINIAPGGVRHWKWADGAQIIHKSSHRGEKAVFRTDDARHGLRIRPGAIGYKLGADGKPTGVRGGRFHVEITDIDFYNRSPRPKRMGALHFEVGASAGSGVLATLVVRDSTFSGGKNALFMPSGASMLYAENSEFSRGHGKRVNQEHSIYINGTLLSHFNNVKIYGDRANGARGGHQLKVKSGIVVLESVELGNGGGDYDPSNMPLYDGASQSYVWSENLLLKRVLSDRPRNGLVDLRRNSYRSDALKWPMETAEGADMGAMPPGCENIKPEYEEYYIQVFRDTVVHSELEEAFVFRQSGFFDTLFKGRKGKTPYEEIAASPTRNRAWLFTFNTQHDAERVTSDAYYYRRPKIPTYHCENPSLPKGLKAIVDDRDKFISYAIGRFKSANTGMYDK